MAGMDWFHLFPNGNQRKHVVNVVICVYYLSSNLYIWCIYLVSPDDGSP
jgi:hypothetical protein